MYEHSRKVHTNSKSLDLDPRVRIAASYHTKVFAIYIIRRPFPEKPQQKP